MWSPYYFSYMSYISLTSATYRPSDTELCVEVRLSDTARIHITPFNMTQYPVMPSCACMCVPVTLNIYDLVHLAILSFLCQFWSLFLKLKPNLSIFNSSFGFIWFNKSLKVQFIVHLNFKLVNFETFVPILNLNCHFCNLFQPAFWFI